MDQTKVTVFRVLIVDDHPVVRQGLATIVNAEPDFMVCGLAGTDQEAIRMADETKPDIISLDLRLKEKSGLDLLRYLRKRHKGIKILIASVCDEQIYAERCIRAGAQGFVNKGESRSGIIEALRQVSQGKVYLSGPTADVLINKQLAGGSAEEPFLSKLSNRELQIFEKLAQGMSTREIADELCLSVKTVETHRENIKGKLGFESSRELMRCAIHWAMESE